jgi:hypothetical protein
LILPQLSRNRTGRLIVCFASVSAIYLLALIMKPIELGAAPKGH